MPELPEVETTMRGISPALLHQKITQTTVRRHDLRQPIPLDFASRIQSRTITDISRRSKYILITLDDNSVIIIHLGMSGRITLYPTWQEHYQKHDHVTIQVENGSEITFTDPRRFGLIALTQSTDLVNHPLLKKLGPEPLTKDLTADYLYTKLQRKSVAIKQAIMDNHIVVGVGNIYACESLFRSHISPTRPANSLTKQEMESLIISIKDVLKEAIMAGGSSLRDYATTDGSLGYFQQQLIVYGNEHQPCPVCNSLIQRIKQQGRSSFFCPSCQL